MTLTTNPAWTCEWHGGCNILGSARMNMTCLNILDQTQVMFYPITDEAGTQLVYICTSAFHIVSEVFSFYSSMPKKPYITTIYPQMGLCVVVVVESIVVWFMQILLLHLLFLKNCDALEPLKYLVSTLLKTKNIGVEKYDCSYHPAG